MNLEKIFHPIWADFDPNNHMRHTAYNDYAAEVRVQLLTSKGYSMNKLIELSLGPVLLVEETHFLKEIRQGESIKVDAKLLGISKDGRFWKIRHDIFNNNSKLAAYIIAEGAWIDLKTRKIKQPTQEILDQFLSLSRSEGFHYIEKPKK